MEKINNLTYSLRVDYINDAGVNVSICRKINDNGLELNLVQVGNTRVCKETINGRILSGRYDDENSFCGFRYNYNRKDHEYLVNINESISLDAAINLINKTKMSPNFLSAKMVFTSLLNNNFRVSILSKGNLKVTKTASAENEYGEKCFLQERTYLSKLEGEECFIATSKETICKIDNDCVILDASAEYDKQRHIKELNEIIDQNPHNYKELKNAKKTIEKTHTI